MEKINIFWFRRDLRLFDNTGLNEALLDKNPVLPIFIFDLQILSKLKNKSDRRVQFIFNQLEKIKADIRLFDSDLLVEYGTPTEIFKKLLYKYKIEKVFTNRDYEPEAIYRDVDIKNLLKNYGVQFLTFKDQLIFEKSDILSNSKKPYTMFTPYKKAWLIKLEENKIKSNQILSPN